MRFPIPSLMSPGILFAHLTATVYRAEILIKLPAVKLNQLPKQTNSILTAGRNLSSQQAPLCTCPRCTPQGRGSAWPWHGCRSTGTLEGSTACRGGITPWPFSSEQPHNPWGQQTPRQP